MKNAPAPKSPASHPLSVDNIRSSTLGTLLARVEDAVFVRDAGRRLLYLNPAAETLTGWPLHEAVRQPCYHVFGDPDAKCSEYCPVDRAIAWNQSIVDGEGMLVTRDGRRLDVTVVISPINIDGRALGSIIMLRSHPDTER